jgi:hypothetical protein
MFPETSSSSKPSGKSSSQKGEAGKPVSKGPNLKKIEVGPPVGKQRPVAVGDSKGGSFGS